MRLPINGITLNVAQKGDRQSSQPALVLLHYFGGSSQEWLPVMDRLADRFYCIAPDLRGFGDSDAPATGYSIADYADDILALTGELELAQYVLVGHSMGGKIALAVAARQPAGLAGMILLAPSPPTPEPIDNSDRERLLRGHGQRVQAAETVRKITALFLPLPLFMQAVDDNIHTSRLAWKAWLQNGSREDISAQMPNIAVPVLIAAGECDRVLSAPMLQREVAARLSKASMTTLAGTGHLSPMEAPISVAEVITKALIAADPCDATRYFKSLSNLSA